MLDSSPFKVPEPSQLSGPSDPSSSHLSDSVLVSSPLSSHLGPHDILPLPLPCPGHSILPSSPSPWEFYLYPCVPHHGAQREREICHFTVPKYWILELNFPIFYKSKDSSEILSFTYMDRYLAQISVMILYVSMKLSEKAFIYFSKHKPVLNICQQTPTRNKLIWQLYDF